MYDLSWVALSNLSAPSNSSVKPRCRRGRLLKNGNDGEERALRNAENGFLLFVSKTTPRLLKNCGNSLEILVSQQMFSCLAIQHPCIVSRLSAIRAEIARRYSIKISQGPCMTRE